MHAEVKRAIGREGLFNAKQTIAPQAAILRQCRSFSRIDFTQLDVHDDISLPREHLHGR
jgi:hypothetical protein